MLWNAWGLSQAEEVLEIGKRYLSSGAVTAIMKNEGSDLDTANLLVKNAFVDGGKVLKRLRPAPQGRAHRIRKRSNHVTLVVDSAE